MSFTLRCHGNEYDDLLILFHFSSSETFFLQDTGPAEPKSGMEALTPEVDIIDDLAPPQSFLVTTKVEYTVEGL